MASKKEEHDAMEKLSEKDLWCKDLDDFVQEWNFQLKEEDDYQKSILKTNRRVSRKIGAGKNYSKSKAKNDEEYNPKPLKANPNKGIVKVEQKSHQRFLSMFDNKKKPPKPAGFGNDGASDAEMSGISDDDFDALRADKPAAKEASRAPSEQPANGRVKRAAAAAPKKWIVDDEESESDDSKFLGDVGDMVKGIGGADKIDTTATNGRVSLFAMSRPGSSHGKSTTDLPKLKSKPSRTFDKFDVSDADETNYEMLARSSPQKAPPAPADNLDSFLSDDDQLVPVTKKVPVKAAAKPAPKPKKAPAPKKTSEPPQAKPVQLSPAAKAYAAKQSKMKLTSNVFSDDEDDEVASDSPPPKPVAKAAPKPVKAKPAPKRKVVSDDEDDDLVMEDADSPPPQPAARGRGRPARAAAVVAKAKAKPILIDSDDEMDDDDHDDSAMIEDEQSEDDFDDSD
jgi:DNA topoisomerase-2